MQTRGLASPLGPFCDTSSARRIGSIVFTLPSQYRPLGGPLGMVTSGMAMGTHAGQHKFTKIRLFFLGEYELRGVDIDGTNCGMYR
jgi:hypothetical protein